MSHKRKCIHTFRCDEDGCRNYIEFSYVVRKSSAVRQVREFGWAGYNGEHYCPVHNTKAEPEEDPAEHYRVEGIRHEA